MKTTHRILWLAIALLLLLCSCNGPTTTAPSAPSASGTPSLSSVSPSVVPTSPEKDQRPLFERETFEAPFFGFTQDQKYFVANFKEEGYNTEERGSYLFLVGRELTAGEADTLTLDYKTMLLLREIGACCITEVYSLHRLKSAPNCDTLALREKQTIIVDGHSFESSTVTLLHYIKEPLENAPLIPPENFDPHPTYRPMPERFDTEWLTWLTEEDMGDSGKYPYVSTAGVYKTDYDGYEGPMTPSVWTLWPYDIEEQTYSEYSHFFLDLRLIYADVNAYTGLGTEGSPYEWKIFYRPAGSTEDYKRIEGSPWSASVGGNVVSIKFNLMDYGCEMSLNEDGSAKEYYMIFFLVEKDTDEIVVWTDLAVKWTDSSEAFYQDALRLGLIKDPKS
jgi:hypothetical protein